MIFFNLVFLLLIPFLFGLLILALLLGKRFENYPIIEKIGLSFPIGLGFIALIMFLLGAFNIPLTLLSILIVIFTIFLLVSTYLIKSRPPIFFLAALKFKVSKFSVLEIIMLVLIIIKVVFVYFSAVIKPLIDVDSFQFYSIVAKEIFFRHNFTDLYTTQFYGDKPLLPFLQQGWSFLALNASNDALFKIIYPTFFLCLLLIFYSVLRRSFTRSYSLLFTWLLSALPFIIYHATTAYADLTITLYYASAAFYLFLFMKNKEQDFAMVGFTMLGFAVWSKKAGLILAIVVILVLLAYIFFKDRTAWKKLTVPVLIFMIIILPWLVLGRTGTYEAVIRNIVGHQTSLSPSSSALVQSQPEESKLPVILSIFERKLFLYGDWQLTWALFIAALLFFPRRIFSSPYYFLLAIIFLDMLSLFVQFGSGETLRWLLDGTLFDRLLMNEVPVVLFFCAEVIFDKNHHAASRPL
ncbi:MAG: hypothetical protein QME05_05435 [Candidatus Margulisbacteria bacterium]|nr:hypothetical protein [Candidatus Margulisiibacteriota bacterium]